MTEAADSLSLTAPEAVTSVQPAQAEAEVAVPPEVAGRIDEMVRAFVETMAANDPQSDEYRRRVDEVTEMAEREIRSTSDMSNRLLDRPVRALSGLGEDKTSVAQSLLELRRTVEDLNPAKYDLHQGGPRKLLGFIP